MSLPILYVSRYEMKDITPQYIKQMCRKITADNINKFKLVLGQTDGSILENINDTNLAYNTFLTKFLDIYNINFPIIHKSIKVYSKNHKPWITQGQIKSIHRKYSLYKNYIRKGSVTAKLKYTIYKNKLAKTIRFAEKQYYCIKFELARGNIRQSWQVIQSLIKGPLLAKR